MNIYEKILEYKEKNISSVLITVAGKEGHCPQVSGAKMLIDSDKNTFGTIGGGELEFLAVNEAAEIFNTRKNVLKKYVLNENNNLVGAEKTNMVCGGTITLFYELLNSVPKVYIFGAGHIGQALTEMLKSFNYDINVLDTRKEYKNISENISTQIAS